MGRTNDQQDTEDHLVDSTVELPTLLDDVLTRSCSKAEIERATQDFIHESLEEMDSGTLFVLLKQMKYAAEHGIEQLKEQAFNSIGDWLGGLSTGEMLGHGVAICYPKEWHYSSAVDELKEQQKEELSRLQDREKREGVAKQMMGKGRLTVSLREG